MRFGYNNSKKHKGEIVEREPTRFQPGRVVALHPTKGIRRSRIPPLNAVQNKTLAQRFYDMLQGSVMDSDQKEVHPRSSEFGFLNRPDEVNDKAQKMIALRKKWTQEDQEKRS